MKAHQVIISLCVMALIVIVLSVFRQRQANGAEPPLGTVLISRNLDESLNTSPGHWNHLAIYVGEGQLVESQEDQGVILTPLAEYVARKYQWAAIYPVDNEVGKRAATAAKELVGLPYRKLGTGMRRVRQGLNCVGTIVVAESKALGRKVRGLRIPDQALLQRELFKGVEPESPSVPDLEPAPQWQPMSEDAPEVLPQILPGTKHFMVSELEVRGINAMNEYRAGFNRKPLIVHPVLMKLARKRAAVMTDANAHEPGGIWPGEACHQGGYDFRYVSENFYGHARSPEDAVGAWEQSSGHAAAMRGFVQHNYRWIDAKLVHVGFGMSGRSAVAIFARPLE